MLKKIAQHSSFSKKDYFDHVLALTPSSIYWKDLEGVYLGCNLSMLSMVGFSSLKEIFGKPIMNFLGENRLTHYKEMISKLLNRKNCIVLKRLEP